MIAAAWREGGRRRLVLLGVVLLIVIVLLGTLARSSGPADRMAEARSLTDPGHFETSLEAGDALARIGSLLLEEGRACRGDAGAGEQRCAALLAGAGYAQVMAAHVLRCTAPGRFDARERIARVIEAVSAPSREQVLPPPLPDCR